MIAERMSIGRHLVAQFAHLGRLTVPSHVLAQTMLVLQPIPANAALQFRRLCFQMLTLMQIEYLFAFERFRANVAHMHKRIFMDAAYVIAQNAFRYETTEKT